MEGLEEELVPLVPQAHCHGLIRFLLEKQELGTSQLPQAKDCLQLFSVKFLGEAQRSGKLFFAADHIPCEKNVMREN